MICIHIYIYHTYYLSYAIFLFFAVSFFWVIFPLHDETNNLLLSCSLIISAFHIFFYCNYSFLLHALRLLFSLRFLTIVSFFLLLFYFLVRFSLLFSPFPFLMLIHSIHAVDFPLNISSVLFWSSFPSVYSSVVWFHLKHLYFLYQYLYCSFFFFSISIYLTSFSFSSSLSCSFSFLIF